MAENQEFVRRAKSRAYAPAGVDDTGEEGKLRVYISIIVGFLMLAIFGAAMWMIFEDRFNGIDAYRTKWIIGQRDDYKKRCEENLRNLKQLVTWSKDNGIKPPAEMQVTSECVAPEAISETSAEVNSNGTHPDNHR